MRILNLGGGEIKLHHGMTIGQAQEIKVQRKKPPPPATKTLSEGRRVSARRRLGRQRVARPVRRHVIRRVNMTTTPQEDVASYLLSDIETASGGEGGDASNRAELDAAV